jgi:hypothetical protein
MYSPQIWAKKVDVRAESYWRFLKRDRWFFEKGQVAQGSLKRRKRSWGREAGGKAVDRPNPQISELYGWEGFRVPTNAQGLLVQTTNPLKSVGSLGERQL